MGLVYVRIGIVGISVGAGLATEGQSDTPMPPRQVTPRFRPRRGGRRDSDDAPMHSLGPRVSGKTKRCWATRLRFAGELDWSQLSHILDYV